MMCKKYKHEFNDIALRNSKIWKVVLLALLVYFKLMKETFEFIGATMWFLQKVKIL